MTSQTLRDTGSPKTFTAGPRFSAATQTHAGIPLSPPTRKGRVLGTLHLRLLVAP